MRMSREENGCNLYFIKRNKKEKKLNKSTDNAVANAAPSIPIWLGKDSKYGIKNKFEKKVTTTNNKVK